MGRPQKWSKRKIVNALQRRHRQGLPMRGEIALVSSAVVYFGKWHDALVAAGIVEPGKQLPRPVKWTDQSIIEAIRQWHSDGKSLTVVWRENTALYSTAKVHYGSWRNALRAAGLVDWQEPWTPERVLAEIRALHQQEVSLTQVRCDNEPLYSAGKRYFGSWHNAIRTAGFEYHVRRHWTDESIIDAMLQWHDQGIPMTDIWKRDKRLFNAAIRHFGNWQLALEAAGLEFQDRKQWSRQRVIKELQFWYRTRKVSVRRENPNLSAVALRLFGSLNQALEAAGLEPRYGRWSAQCVLEQIQDRHIRDEPLRRPFPRDRVFCLAAKHFFGSWEQAVQAAGITVSGASE